MGEIPSNFIFNEIDKDLASGVYLKEELRTRFPPEPNGYLHIGHAKAVFISFSVKERYQAATNLRFDDTNPSKEDVEYTEAIQADIEWLGYAWDELRYASDYFEQMYAYALELIGKGLAYVDDQSAEAISASRGTLTEAGTGSPFRDRSIEENTRLFTAMRSGAYATGERVLRAKIDMASPNITLRDPVIYRILHEPHHNTGDAWCIYPLYDYAHPIEDAIEGVTHSLCSIEFEDHRPFYDWVLDHLDAYKEKRPRQIEFARLKVKNALTSKRHLKTLVDNAVVDGWDDPRLYTLRGLRRRGVTPAAIRAFCEAIGIAKADSTITREQFEYFVREDLMASSQPVMAVIDPVRLVITNYPEGEAENLDVPFDQKNPASETRSVPFTRELFIERADFMADPPKKYHRLYPGNEVRLMGAYFVQCTGYTADADGLVTEIQCTYDPETKSGSAFNERKPKGTIHWVSATHSLPALVRHFDEVVPEGKEDLPILERVNPNSLVAFNARLEPYLAAAEIGERYQFMRLGFYCLDSKLSGPGSPVYNQIVPLKSGWKPE
jgi:glutaminyl-tRNA synthetase